jgi:hypothetical protein
MVTPRYANRVDASQPDIVAALEQAGVLVYIIGRPCDLLCRVRSDPPGIMRTLEVKTAQGKRAPKLKLRKDQQEQAQFCIDTGTPYVTNAIEALRALRLVT